MTGEAHTAASMGALMFAGGAMGYAKKGSVPSLAAGCCFGTGYLVSAWLIRDRDPRSGHLLGAGLSTTLMAAMGARAYKTRAPLPTGLAGLGLVSGAYFAYKAHQWS